MCDAIKMFLDKAAYVGGRFKRVDRYWKQEMASLASELLFKGRLLLKREKERANSFLKRELPMKQETDITKTSLSHLDVYPISVNIFRGGDGGSNGGASGGGINIETVVAHIDGKT